MLMRVRADRPLLSEDLAHNVKRGPGYFCAQQEGQVWVNHLVILLTPCFVLPRGVFPD